MTERQLKDNAAQQRLEIEVAGQVVFSNYRREGKVVHLTHVEAPPALRGSGAAGQLMQAIVDWANAEDLELVPVCSYAVHWLQRHDRG